MAGPKKCLRILDWLSLAARWRAALVGGVSIIMLISAPPVRADAAIGESLARQWCSSCHEVGHGRVTSDGAPSFKAVARRPGTTRDSLRNWLSDPHPPMPNLDLARQDIEDLIDYIETLKRK
jgi:mono/diheme cytochrome c family protein